MESQNSNANQARVEFNIAADALNQIDSRGLTEMRCIRCPHDALVKVFELVYILFGNDEPYSPDAMRSMIGNSEFVNKLRSFNILKLITVRQIKIIK